MLNDKTILVTGGTGFLGSHLLKKLLNTQQYNIVVLKRSFSNLWRIKNEISSELVKYYDIDIIDLEKIFTENSINAIIHCATEYGRNQTSCLKVLQSNLIFPIELLELAVKYHVEAFINTDSYFNKNGLSYPYLLNYSLSKKSLELWLDKFSENIKIANLMLEHVYGEYDNKDKFVSQMIHKIAIDRLPFVELSSGKQKRDFIYVQDVCDIYIKILEEIFYEKCNYKTIEVGTGKSISIKDFVEEIHRISNSKTELRFGAIPTRKDEIKDSKATKNRCKINFTPTNIAIKKIIEVESQI